MKLLSKILYGTAFLFSLLPLPLLYLLSDLIWLIMFICPPLRYRRKIVRRNLTSSFPEKTPAEIAAIERAFYHNFTDQMAEMLKTFSITERGFRRRVEFRDKDIIHKYAAQGKSVVAYLGHLGNWEWLISMPCLFDRTGPDIPQFCEVYHRLENPIAEEMMQKVRGRFGCDGIPMEHTLRRLLEYRRDNRAFVCAMISDQVPLYWNTHYWTDFLNHYTPVLTGAERIVRKMNLVPMYVRMVRVRRGHYRVEMEPMNEAMESKEPYALTELFMRMLEDDIKNDPPTWLWTHNRWKRTWEGYKQWADTHPGSERDRMSNDRE